MLGCETSGDFEKQVAESQRATFVFGVDYECVPGGAVSKIKSVIPATQMKQPLLSH